MLAYDKSLNRKEMWEYASIDLSYHCSYDNLKKIHSEKMLANH